MPSFSLDFTRAACLPLCSPLLLHPHVSSPSLQYRLLSCLSAAKGLVEAKSSAQGISTLKMRNGNHPNWNECLAGDREPNTSSHFSSSLEALKGKFVFYLDILVISILLFPKQLSLPTNEVLAETMGPVFFSSTVK